MKNLIVLVFFAVMISGTAMAQNKANNPCKEDRQKLCSSCERGDRDCVKTCMRSNKDNVSQACKDHRTARRAARRASRTSK